MVMPIFSLDSHNQSPTSTAPDPTALPLPIPSASTLSKPAVLLRSTPSPRSSVWVGSFRPHPFPATPSRHSLAPTMTSAISAASDHVWTPRIQCIPSILLWLLPPSKIPPLDRLAALPLAPTLLKNSPLDHLAAVPPAITLLKKSPLDRLAALPPAPALLKNSPLDRLAVLPPAPALLKNSPLDRLPGFPPAPACPRPHRRLASQRLRRSPLYPRPHHGIAFHLPESRLDRWRSCWCGFQPILRLSIAHLGGPTFGHSSSLVGPNFFSDPSPFRRCRCDSLHSNGLRI